MPILNYTTKIDSFKTVQEIQKKLAEHGAQSIIIDYDEKQNPCALTFMMMIKTYPVNFRLPANFKGIRRLLNENSKVPNSLRTDEQAIRVSWRITKDWIESQLAFIEAEQAELAQIFLPYAVTPSGQTLYQHIQEGNMKLLTN